MKFVRVGSDSRSGVGGFVKGVRVGSGSGSGVGEFLVGVRVESVLGIGVSNVTGSGKGVGAGYSLGAGVGNDAKFGRLVKGEDVGYLTTGDSSVSLSDVQFPCPQYTPTLIAVAKTTAMTINANTLMCLRRSQFNEVRYVDLATSCLFGAVDDANGISTAISSLLLCAGRVDVVPTTGVSFS